MGAPVCIISRMNTKMDYFEPILAIVLSVLTIASTAIGIQCIGDDDKKKTNKQFLVAMLIFAIIAFLISIGVIVYTAQQV
jgi:hypothetical protein